MFGLILRGWWRCYGRFYALAMRPLWRSVNEYLVRGVIRASRSLVHWERGLSASAWMDGKGRLVDNVFVERLWRGVKYEETYLKAYDSVGAVRASLGALYSTEQRHKSLDRQTPDGVNFREAAKLEA